MLSTKVNLGLFVTVGTLLFAVGLFWVGDRKKVFSRGFEVYTEMDRVAGLEPGANVRVAGLDAGEVKGIDVPVAQHMGYRLRIRLDRKFRPLVRQDSIAVIQTDGLVGSKYLEIEKGSDDVKECGDPCTLMSMDAFDFSDLMVEARELLHSTDTAMQGAGKVTENLNRALGTFLAKNEDGKSGAANLTATMASAQVAMTNLADNAEALKHNFLFRGFFNKRGFFNLNELSPSAYRDSAFVKSKDARRVWLEGKQLFSTSRNGMEALTDGGRKALDTAMAEYVPFLPNSPLMIEGYSAEGSPEDKYRKAQQRAVLAQAYVQSRFQLNPKYIGAIPLVETPPVKTGKTSWDGLALVLVPTK
ncbi:MAG: MlaD family protein [Bryobacteraceae bacterium]